MILSLLSSSRAKCILLVGCGAPALFAAVAAEARTSAEGEARISECIRQAAEGRPWLEKTLWGLRDQEAGWIGAEVRNTNGSHDLGPLQINSWWVPKIVALVGHPAADVRHWLRFDPCFNAGAARWIFLTALRETGDYWHAVGIYHSPTAWRQRRYALSVVRHMQRRFGREAFAGTATPAPVEKASVESAAESRRAQPVITTHGFGTVRSPAS